MNFDRLKGLLHGLVDVAVKHPAGRDEGHALVDEHFAAAEKADAEARAQAQADAAEEAARKQAEGGQGS